MSKYCAQDLTAPPMIDTIGHLLLVLYDKVQLLSQDRQISP